jgi:RpiB/LacA/LacB family sugar-phosphate isomerase
MKIILGSVVKGFNLKSSLKKHFDIHEYQVIDVGCFGTDRFVKFPSIAERVAKALQDGFANFAVNCCGSGTGAGILTNKYRGVCAVSCESVQTARLARIVNDANCLCLGESVISSELACKMADVFLHTRFGDSDDVQKGVLDFWDEARRKAYAMGETAQSRQIEFL